MQMQQARHRRKLFGGRMSAEEVHAKLAFPPGSKCSGCGARPTVRGIVLMELVEARKNPLVEAMALADPQAFLSQVVDIKQSDGKGKPYFRCSVAYACKTCSPAMEKQLAKAPSHCIVEINRGPGRDPIYG